MQKQCAQCGSSFEITQSDLTFYDAVSPIIGEKKFAIPPPTHCPDCRQQRRLAFRNERQLYHRTCDLTGKSIITNFGPHTGMKVYDQHEWWTNKWDSLEYGRDVNFSRPFFEQFAELQREVPQLSLSVWNSENADYCNYIGHVKNSYLIFGSVYSEDCYYGSPYYSRDCLDTLVIRECEQCYECIDCRKLTQCFYCQDCWHSDNLLFCFDCQGCSDCIGCAGLRKKKFCVFNEELGEEEYRRREAELNLCVPKVHELLRAKLKELSLTIPHRYMRSAQVEGVSGNYVYESKNMHDSFYADRCEDCRYCAQVVDLKDCYDNNYTEENELCCDYLGAYQVQRVCFSKFCNKASDSLYCDACHQNSHHLFGCIGLKRKSYCILNKQYTKEEYEVLVPKIIDYMRKTPYQSPYGSGTGQVSGSAPNQLLRNGSGQAMKSGSSAACTSWGEFFPVTLSPFAYNETVAQEYFPLQKEDAEKKGWPWHSEKREEQYLGPAVEIPENIEDVPDDICEKILLCEVTFRPYKIIPQELRFYRKMKLPIPRKCPDQRHFERLAMRNPRKLWSRTCGKCEKTIRTSYSPERSEIVYCESCYLSAVY